MTSSHFSWEECYIIVSLGKRYSLRGKDVRASQAVLYVNEPAKDRKSQSGDLIRPKSRSFVTHDS